MLSTLDLKGKLGYIEKDGSFVFRRKSNMTTWTIYHNYKVNGSLEEKQNRIKTLKKEIKKLEKLDDDSFEYALDIDQRFTEIDNLTRDIAYIKAKKDYDEMNKSTSRGIGSTKSSSTGK